MLVPSKVLNNVKHKLLVVQRAFEKEKIDRYGRMIAHMQITGDIPSEMRAREFNEIAMWDAIARRSREIQEAHVKAMGVVAVINPEELKPRGDDEVQDSE